MLLPVQSWNAWKKNMLGGIPQESWDNAEWRPGAYACCLEALSGEKFQDLAEYARKENTGFAEVLGGAVEEFLLGRAVA